MGKEALVYLEINKSLVLNYFLPKNTPKTTQRDPLLSLGKFGCG